MPTRTSVSNSFLALAGVVIPVLLASCAGGTRSTIRNREQHAPPQAVERTPPRNQSSRSVNALAHDRDVWQQLLMDNSKIRRTVRHTENGVEATTESDDPRVAAKIIEHAKAMQARMKAGARVRVWDPVFADLFAKHAAVSIEVTPTDRGVTIVESSADPEALVLLRSHAMGVSEFVREGHKAAPRETPRFKAGDSLPAPELAIGGVPHRFMLTQPDATQLAGLKSAGVGAIINFRKPAEHPEYNEQGAAAETGMTYCNPGYTNASDMSDDVLDAGRAAIKQAAEKGEVAALHCRTGNRAGPAWAAYRVLDQSVSLEQAIGEAKAMQMVDPLMESKTRDYIRRQGVEIRPWTPVAPDDLSPSQKVQGDRAVAARNAMSGRLFAQLGQAMQAVGSDGIRAGPIDAIGVCKDEAPKIARAVAREKGVMIGRTSEKLRNSSNAAPPWATNLLAERPTEQRFLANGDGSLGVVLPINITSNCLACHGAIESIDPGVRDALASKYPKDRATGYKDGDLRGWFWIEVPPASAR